MDLSACIRQEARQPATVEGLSGQGMIFNIQRYSLHDGPGIRTIVFLQGCPLHCLWCANPESQAGRPVLLYSRSKCIGCQTCAQICPEHAILFAGTPYPVIDRKACTHCGLCASGCCTEALDLEGHVATVAEVLAEVMKDEAFYTGSGGGLTLSGGEVLAQPDFACALLNAAKVQGLHTAIETTGWASTETLMRVAGRTDLVLYDLKHHDPDKHLEGTGVALAPILHNLRELIGTGRPVIVRIPVVPGYNDSLTDAGQFGRLLKDLSVRQVDLLPFHQFGQGKYDQLGLNYACSGLKALHAEDLPDYRQVLEDFGLAVSFS